VVRPAVGALLVRGAGRIAGPLVPDGIGGWFSLPQLDRNAWFEHQIKPYGIAGRVGLALRGTLLGAGAHPSVVAGVFVRIALRGCIYCFASVLARFAALPV